MSRRRIVCFAGSTIEVIERDSGAIALSGFLFDRFASQPSDDPAVRLELASDAPTTFSLWRDGTLVYRATPAVTAARLLLAEAVHSLSLNHQKYILMHAAAVAYAGRGFLLPGPSGAGKSTLAAWLDHHGFGCLSDEIVAISLVDTGMLAFPRPICLQADASVPLRRILDLARVEGRLLEGEDALIIAQRSPVPLFPVPLKGIIFPIYVPYANAEMRLLSKAAAAIRLLGSVVNVGSRKDRGFSEFGSLVDRVPVFELCYGDFDHGAELFMQAMAIDLDRKESGDATTGAALETAMNRLDANRAG